MVQVPCYVNGAAHCGFVSRQGVRAGRCAYGSRYAWESACRGRRWSVSIVSESHKKGCRVTSVAEGVRVDVGNKAERGTVTEIQPEVQDGVDFLARIKMYAKKGLVPETKIGVLTEWFRSYTNAAKKSRHVTVDPRLLSERLFLTLIELVRQECLTPSPFKCYHERVRSPFDYYQFGMEFATILVDVWHSKVFGKNHILTAYEQLQRGNNVVFVSNHQSEGDPHAIDVLMNRVVGLPEEFAENIVFMAGDRVRDDPIVAPFSRGRNLLNVYSKKHINDVPRLRGEKLRHNRRAISATRALFKKGGCCIWFAPSGGRDRRSQETGKVEISPLNHESLEMMRITAKKSGKVVHFYSMALATYALLPPPEKVGGATLGEVRKVTYSPMGMAVGAEIDWDTVVPDNIKGKAEKIRYRGEHVQQMVENEYSKIEGYAQ